MTNYFQIYSFSWKWGVTELQLGKFSLMESNPLQQIENVCSKIVKSISTPDLVVGSCFLPTLTSSKQQMQLRICKHNYTILLQNYDVIYKTLQNKAVIHHVHKKTHKFVF